MVLARPSAASAEAPASALVPASTVAEEPVEDTRSIAALDLVWRAPAECGSDEEFFAALRSMVRHALQRRSHAWLEAEVTLAPHPEHGWEAKLELAHGDLRQHRSFTAPTCAELVQASAVTVGAHVLRHGDDARARVPEEPGAASVEEAGVAPSPAPASPPRGPVEPGASPAGSVPPAPAPESRGEEGDWRESAAGTAVIGSPDSAAARAELRGAGEPTQASAEPVGPRPSRRLHVHLHARAGVAIGLGPGVGAGFEGGLTLGARRVGGQLGVLHRIRGDSPPVNGIFVRTSLTAVGLSLCWRPGGQRFAFPLCAGGAVGAAVGEGRGELLASARSTRIWLGLPVEAGAVWQMQPRVGLRFAIAGVAGTRSGYFARTAAGDASIYAYPALSGVFWLGLEGRLR